MLQFRKEVVTIMTTTQQPITKKPSYVKDLVLLFSIPLGIVLIVSLVVYLPTLFAHPSYGFLYSYCNDYSCNGNYSIDQTNHIAQNGVAIHNNGITTSQTQLAYYDPATGSSKVLTAKEAQTYRLINSSRSPDGYTLVHDTGGDGFLFWGNYQDSWRLENGMKKKLVHLNGTDQQYSDSINFIGWVQK